MDDMTLPAVSFVIVAGGSIQLGLLRVRAAVRCRLYPPGAATPPAGGYSHPHR